MDVLHLRSRSKNWTAQVRLMTLKNRRKFWGAQAASLQVSATCRDGIGRRLELRAQKCCRQGCRQLQAGSLCSPDHEALRGVSLRVLAVHVLHNVGLRLQSTCSWEIISLLSCARTVQQALSCCAFWNCEIFPWQACARLAQPAPQANQFQFGVNPSP